MSWEDERCPRCGGYPGHKEGCLPPPSSTIPKPKAANPAPEPKVEKTVIKRGK